MVGKFFCNPLQIRVWLKLSESRFTKLFLWMQKSKKNAAGLAVAWLLLSGVLERKDNDLDAKTAVFFLHVMILTNGLQIASLGLKNGCWSDRLLKP